MTRIVVRLAVLVLAPPAVAPAQNVHPPPIPPPEVRAVAVPAGSPLRLDGRLDEVVWSTQSPATDFRQNQPKEGQPATLRTEVRFAYDGAALYVGARMFDDLGAAGVRTRLVRRDGTLDSDYLEVIFDPYHDHIGRLFFTVNPSGVRSDANGLGGGGTSRGIRSGRWRRRSTRSAGRPSCAFRFRSCATPRRRRRSRRGGSRSGARRTG